MYGSDPLFSAGSRQGDKIGDVPSNGISAIRVKDKGVPIGPGMAVTAYGEELLTLRCPPILGKSENSYAHGSVVMLHGISFDPSILKPPH